MRSFLLLGVLLFVELAAAPGPHSRQIDAIFSGMQSNNAPGAAVLVIKDGHTVFERGYGVTDLRTLRKIDGLTNFRLASLSKQFTAMAVMLLVHDGKLRYDESLADIFPDFPQYGKSITIRHLLNHTSGLLDYEDLMQPQLDVPEDKLVQIKDAGVLELLKQQKTTKFAPGTKWEYSNSGYVVLGMVVQKVSHQPFAQFLRDRIFVPLKMTATIAYEKPVHGSGPEEPGHEERQDDNTIPRRAYGHTHKQGRWQQNDQSPTSATLGDGGIYMSLEDLAKWDAALREYTLLSETEMQPAITPVKAPGVQGPNGEPAEYGFGWYLNPYKNHARMWHYGETVGFRTNIQRFVKHGLTVIVLCNRDDLNPGELALRVADLYFSEH